MSKACEPLCSFGHRLYFTTFPSPVPSQHVLNNMGSSLGKNPPIRGAERNRGAVTPDDDATYYYFTIDDSLVYLSFYEDWGPLNLAMVYKACILIHELLEDPELASHRLVLYASSDPRRKANAALLMALYVMIVKRQTPWEAFQPIAEVEFMPFRDAGRGKSDFNLSIQDCLWGIWKAMQNGLCDMNEFSVDDYEFYEKVENGDWNWITPNFIAFASPTDSQWLKNKDKDPGAHSTALQRKLPTPFLNCLDYFEKKGVKLVVRLNNVLYDRQLFIDRGIEHVEMFFEDGTNPTDEIVRSFIDMADKTITEGGVVAVHCKAGLGRTGSLIGAYLIWKYGFTAGEAIAFMRIVRPGSVVGPQQQYMYLKQLEWCKWAAADEIMKLQAAVTAASSAVVAPVTPPAEDTDNETMESIPLLPPVTPSKHVASSTAAARAIPPPAQPRKTPTAKRVASDLDEEDDEISGLPMTGPRRPVVRSKTTSSRVPTSDARRAASRAGTRPPPTRKPLPPVTASKGPPYKIPRLADDFATARRPAQPPSPSPIRRIRPVSPPPQSRLPTLVNKRTAPLQTTMTLPELSMKIKAAPSADAWMSANPSAVVVPGTKSERPLLRNVKKRRSSFSAADVVA
ncbi:phosphatases II [Sistotremastrum suecicum HHB10207 ss-3]|uniref:protein-tyrosine-phosphatase n=1 Tax=Sistotremastrum suecicum HHB10207 ss-3 TaxID=1314776 RepID=A0A166DV41_9AGAM|nr:phosphatases II [Sistotremastrum suecicum HHB10207 ss-3]